MLSRSPHSPRSSRSARAALVASAAAAALVLPALPAHGAVGGFVALGDSYASGTGTGRYLADGTSCQRSTSAYPALLAGEQGLALAFRACSGATTADVRELQLGALRRSTAYVTISAGGNDAGFTAVLTECAKPAWASRCPAIVDRSRAVIRRQLPRRLADLYADIRRRAPRAEVVVVGYPRIFGGEDCNGLTWFSPAEQSRLNATADLLNARLAVAARTAGFTFADPTAAYRGRAVCGRPEWLNGLSRPVSESYHPNRAGHATGFAPLVRSALLGTAEPINPAAATRTAAAAGRLAGEQRRHAVQDRSITPETFVPPDLDSPAIRRAAARAGVDLDSRTSVDAADRRYSARQAAG